jgi:S-methylmethionine-dependent homocysteine/selenocysteine methylase
MEQRPAPFVGAPFWITDGGLETSLIFLEKVDLPKFAAFPLVDSAEGRRILRKYYQQYLDLAAESGLGFLLDTPTWRASSDWAAMLGYSTETLRELNRKAVELCAEVLHEHQHKSGPAVPIVLNGALGPRGDGYQALQRMSADEAEQYHSLQIDTVASAGVKLITAYTMNYVEEAIGFARRAKKVGLPVVISFTVETDGKLPSGQALGEAIEAVDSETDRAVLFYIINCAHPVHFVPTLLSAAESGCSWVERLGGLRVNASKKSHAELDESNELDIGDPPEFQFHFKSLLERFPKLLVCGGCCGTDLRHLKEIATACRELAHKRA